MRYLRTSDRGSALILAMIVSLVGAGMAATALAVTAVQTKTTARMATRERALTVAESGLDDVVFRMNSWAGGSPVSTATGTIGGDTYTVTIAPAFSGAAGQYTLRASSTRDHEKRGIEAVVSPTVVSPFPYGLSSKNGIVTSGAMATDSYNSKAGSYLSQRTNYDPVHAMYYAHPGGNVGANGNISGSGSVTLYGNAAPGPTGNWSSSGGAYVYGTTTPMASSMVFQPVPPYSPPIPSSGALGPSGAMTLTTGTYHYDKITVSGGNSLHFSGDVTIYVDGDVSISGSAFLHQLTGANVKIIQNAGKFTLSGGGLVNDTLDASKFTVTSATTSAVTFSGGSTYFGTVYAPNAPFTASGATNFFGAFVASSMTLSGGAFFHYDEALGSAGAPSGYRIRSWIEFIP